MQYSTLFPCLQGFFAISFGSFFRFLLSSIYRQTIKQKQHTAAITFGCLAIYLARILPGSGRKRAFRSRRRV